MRRTEVIDPEEIVRQRRLGWPDFHPEDYCHRCGRRNMTWSSPEWPELVGGHGGILCPVCFADYDQNAIWILTRWHPPGEDRTELLTALLRSVSNLGEDTERVARCVVNAGWIKP